MNKYGLEHMLCPQHEFVDNSDIKMVVLESDHRKPHESCVVIGENGCDWRVGGQEEHDRWVAMIEQQAQAQGVSAIYLQMQSIRSAR